MHGERTVRDWANLGLTGRTRGVFKICEEPSEYVSSASVVLATAELGSGTGLRVDLTGARGGAFRTKGNEDGSCAL